ncbi:MAG: hypothetical protein U0Q03_00555 [Acidimicrobiales bacterium]
MGATDTGRRPARRTVAAAAALATVTLLALPSSAAHASARSEAPTPEEQLAERYAPVMMPRSQSTRCGGGEPYQPIDVDALWGRPEVVLRTPDGTITAPTAEQLAAAGPDAHLDLPGNALRPGCDYERFEDALGVTATVYAHVLPDGAGGTAVQYWMFYVYNDWNDRHEGDWEMIQLLFEAPDATAALASEPDVVAYAQHEGAELSHWDDGPLQLVDGTHPLVFPGQGSHAAYFESDEWFGKSAQSGFGCDDTSSPNTELRPQVILLDDAAPPTWLAYEGRWGERQPSFNNGPTGPATKEKWRSPREWVEREGRWGAVPLPAGGSKVTDFFCTVTAAGSQVMFRAIDQPWVVAGAALLVVAFLGWLAWRTRWSPVVLPPSDQPRRGGQMLRTAWRVVRREPLRFAQLGLLLPVAGVLATVVQALVFAVTGFGALEGVLGRESVFGGLLASGIGLAILGPATALVAVTAMEAVRHPGTQRPGVRELVSTARQRTRAIVTQIVLAAGVAVGLLVTPLLPLGLWWQARSAVAVPAAIDGPQPFAHSAELTRHHRVRALGLTWISALIGVFAPLLVGLSVLLLSDRSFTFVNLVAGVVGLFTVPLAGVVGQLQYDDLTVRATAASSTTPT